MTEPSNIKPASEDVALLRAVIKIALATVGLVAAICFLVWGLPSWS